MSNWLGGKAGLVDFNDVFRHCKIESRLWLRHVDGWKKWSQVDRDFRAQRLVGACVDHRGLLTLRTCYIQFWDFLFFS